MSYIIPFSQVTMADLPKVGGKNASLGEMIQYLSKAGIKVPGGFALDTQAYLDFLTDNQLDKKIQTMLQDLDADDLTALKQASQNIQKAILQASFSEAHIAAIKKAYDELAQHNPEMSFAVRSSATAEDMPDASFAGQQETFLNVRGFEHLLQAIKQVYASLYGERAISYRVHQNFEHDKVAISVGVQQMVRSDLGASGVLFTIDTESGFDKVVFITASYGLGETIVQGKVNPDEFYVYKPKLREGKPAVIRRTLGSKELKMVYTDSLQNPVCFTEVDKAEQEKYCINDEDILTLANYALIIEEHYKKPMDVEWGKDGVTGEIYILQARPETIKAHESNLVLEQYRLLEKGKVLVQGRSVGQKIGQGKARLIQSPHDINLLERGEVLVTDMTDPDWEPIMKKASAIVTNRGGRTCHAAIIARELGIPAVVGCGDATAQIQDGAAVTVSCAEGETGNIYSGLLKFDLKKISLEAMPKLPVKIYVNIANPEQAFTCQFVPNEGVGLTRLEFIISNMIGMHPNACLRFNELPVDLQKQVLKKSNAYGSPVEFYTEKLTEGIATIAAAFYPKPIIVRFSDFKSNEYANLLGGAQFEPHEENPMIGFRGGSRYLSDEFRACFALECEAVKRVREKLGLTNVNVMLPFIRTVFEEKAVIDLLKQNGLERGQQGLKLFLMCEVPSNAILAEEFLEHVDGFSIGSNDLTQLTLGLDRDSSLVANLFDERNAAILKLLENVIATCKRKGKYIGICGQGPSDHLDFAKWLMEQGIETISLISDSIVRTWLALAEESK